MGPPTFVVVLIIASIVLFILCIFLSIGCSIWYQMKYSREKRQYKLAKKLNKHQTPMVVVGDTDPVIGPEQGGIGLHIMTHPLTKVMPIRLERGWPITTRRLRHNSAHACEDEEAKEVQKEQEAQEVGILELNASGSDSEGDDSTSTCRRQRLAPVLLLIGP